MVLSFRMLIVKSFKFDNSAPVVLFFSTLLILCQKKIIFKEMCVSFIRLIAICIRYLYLNGMYLKFTTSCTSCFMFSTKN